MSDTDDHARLARRPPASSAASTAGWRCTTDGRRIVRVRGDKSHPGSQGYTCEKGCASTTTRTHVTASPARCDDGPTARYEPVDWDTAIREVAERLAAVRDDPRRCVDLLLRRRRAGEPPRRGLRPVAAHGGRQRLLVERARAGEDRRVLGRRSALRRQRCHTTGDYEHAEVAVFLGKNPWQSHGFPRARVVLKEIAKDPDACARRHRPAPHRDRGARRLPPPGEARHRRVVPRRAAQGRGRGAARPTRRSSSEHTVGFDGSGRRAALDRRRRPWSAGRGRRPRPRAYRRPPYRRRAQRLDLRGPRHPAGAAQHPQLVPGEAAVTS